KGGLGPQRAVQRTWRAAAPDAGRGSAPDTLTSATCLVAASAWVYQPPFALLFICARDSAARPTDGDAGSGRGYHARSARPRPIVPAARVGIWSLAALASRIVG